MRLLSALFAALLFTGCAGLVPLELRNPLLADELFGPSSVRVQADDVFAVDDAMRAYLRREVLPHARSRGLVPALTDALYTRGRLSLEYDSARTRNAREAFEARSGNCLSLVIMTAAIARELGLEVRFNAVLDEAGWERSGDLYLYVGHVNLSLGPRMQHGGFYAGTSDWVTIDFLPSREGRRRRVDGIDESRIVAMYMNNRAAEALAAARLDDAYAWARAAVLQDRRYWTAYNTLGVVYQKRGAHAQAEAVFRSALAAEPDNVHVLGNLVLALQRQGRSAEAEVHAAELRRLQPVPPFAWFREGQRALQAGDYRRAASLFERELGRSADYHEFHFWLAVALWNLGDTRSAREHLEKALENSTSREQTSIYAGKLQKIDAARARATKGS